MRHNIELSGWVGQDPELRYTDSGTAVVNFSLATTRSYKQGEEWVDETIWWRCSVWGKFAETVNNHVTKGTFVMIHEARPNIDPDTGGPRIWIDNDGIPRANYEITVSKMQWLKKASGYGKQDDTQKPHTPDHKQKKAYPKQDPQSEDEIAF